MEATTPRSRRVERDDTLILATGSDPFVIPVPGMICKASAMSAPCAAAAAGLSAFDHVWHEARRVAGDEAILANPDSRRRAVDNPTADDGKHPGRRLGQGV